MGYENHEQGWRLQSFSHAQKAPPPLPPLMRAMLTEQPPEGHEGGDTRYCALLLSPRTASYGPRRGTLGPICLAPSTAKGEFHPWIYAWRSPAALMSRHFRLAR